MKRKYYNRYSTDEERLANCPDRVDPNQWKILVAFWGSEAAKVLKQLFSFGVCIF